MVLLFIFLALALLPFNIWFLSSGILTHGDWMYFFSETQREMLSLPNIWTNSGLGQINLGLMAYPITFGWGILSFLGFGISERLLYMIPSILLAYWGSYKLLNLFFNNKLAVILGVFTYTLNTYFMFGRTGHLTLMVSFAIAPFIFYFFHKYLISKKKLYFITFLLASALANFYEFRAFYLIAIILGVIGLFSATVEKSISFKRLFFIFAIYFAFILLINLYWMLPFQMTNFLKNNEIIGRSLFGNGFMRIDRAFGLFHPFWSGGEIIPFEVQKMPIFMWFIPIIVILGLLYSNQKPLVLLYGLISIIGIFFTKQSNQPFSGVYEWVYNNVPGFSAYREASKFYFLIAIGYSFVITGFFDWLMNLRTNKRYLILTKFLLLSLIAGIFLWNTKPILTGEIGTLFIPRIKPEDYSKLKTQVEFHKKLYRTLWIPRSSRWALYTNKYPLVSLVDTKFSCSRGDKCLNILDNYISNQILDLHSIKYVIVPIQDIANDDDFFHFYGHPRQYYIDQLLKLDYLKKIDIETSELVIFENSNYRPLIYISNENNVSEINIDQVNSAQYQANIIVPEDKYVLHFINSFHPDWKLRIGDFNWFDSITKKDYFYPDEYHFKSELDLNRWIIDKNWIIKNGYISGDAVPITIYFAPQAYVILGGIISIGTLVIITASLLIIQINDYKKKNN